MASLLENFFDFHCSATCINQQILTYVYSFGMYYITNIWNMCIGNWSKAVAKLYMIIALILNLLFWLAIPTSNWIRNCIMFLINLPVTKATVIGYSSSRQMPKTSISWKPVWIYFNSQIEFWTKSCLSQNFLSCLEIYFKHGPPGVVHYVFIQSYYMKNIHTWHHSSRSMYEINLPTG